MLKNFFCFTLYLHRKQFCGKFCCINFLCKFGFGPNSCFTFTTHLYRDYHNIYPSNVPFLKNSSSPSYFYRTEFLVQFLSLAIFTNQGFIVLPFRKFIYLYHFYSLRFAILSHNFFNRMFIGHTFKIVQVFSFVFLWEKNFCVQFFYI